MNIKGKIREILLMMLKKGVTLLLAINVVLVIVLIIKGQMTIEGIVIRMLKVTLIGTTIFIVIFVPRRLLKRSKVFRRFCVYIYRKHPIILYYRFRVTNLLAYVEFIAVYMLPYYSKRILHLIFVGSRYENMWPYRKNHKKLEPGVIILLEPIYYIGYIMLYCFKIFYNIVLFYDNTSIKTIIKTRIIGFVMFIILIYILGAKWIVKEIIIFIIIVFIYRCLNIGLSYKEQKKKYIENGVKFNESQRTIMVRNAFDISGFEMRTQLLLDYKGGIEEKRQKSILLLSVLDRGSIRSLHRKYPNRHFKGLSLVSWSYYHIKEKRFQTPGEAKHPKTTPIKPTYIDMSEIEYKAVYHNKYVESIITRSEFFDYGLEDLTNFKAIYGIQTYSGVMQRFSMEKIEYSSILKEEVSLELLMKMLLIDMTSAGYERDYEFYMWMMTEVGGGFIEFRKLSKIAKMYLKIVEKEGGKEVFAEKYLMDLDLINEKQLGYDVYIKENRRLVDIVFK